MESRWNDTEAERVVRERTADVSELLALRTYSARLLGAEPALVLHGGGNTSVKATATTLFGETIDVLHVKGSGWDLATIEPPGHPAVRMTPLQRLLELPEMSDEQMVNALRLALLDASAPTPSVETLLHAALPARFIDHTHADALLAVVDQTNARAFCEEIFGADLLYIPYVMPGFGLARSCKDAWDRATSEGRSPTVMVLEQHGIFTFGETAKESYERMVDAVTRCERFAANYSITSSDRDVAPPTDDVVANALVVLRGAFASAANAAGSRAPIVSLRTSPRILSFLERADLATASQRGTATPDHVLRTKPWPMVLSAPSYDDTSAFAASTEAALAAYAERYDAYFDDATRAKQVTKKRLDPWPRIVLLPRIGFCAVAPTKKDADIAADVYEHTIDVIETADAIGSYQPVSAHDLFDVEYWSLEQAKLKPAVELPLGRRVALVTGAASGIGLATATLLADLGAHVVLCDRDEQALAEAHTSFAKKKSQVTTIAVDVTHAPNVDRAFVHAAKTFGSVDLVVSNAGGASTGRLDTAEGEATLRASLELNLLSHVNIARAAAHHMRLSGRGGCLLFNASKSAFNQGPGFGPYAVPKAALVSLMRQYAVDLAKDGIRSNAVNADRIRTNLFGNGMAEARAAARGISVDEYFRTNLLRREVTARDVAEAFAWLAQAEATTGCVVTVDGGNAEAFPR